MNFPHIKITNRPICQADLMQMVICIEREEEEEISLTSLKNHARLCDAIHYRTQNVNQRWLFNQNKQYHKGPGGGG